MIDKTQIITQDVKSRVVFPVCAYCERRHYGEHTSLAFANESETAWVQREGEGDGGGFRADQQH